MYAWCVMFSITKIKLKGTKQCFAVIFSYFGTCMSTNEHTILAPTKSPCDIYKFLYKMRS